MTAKSRPSTPAQQTWNQGRKDGKKPAKKPKKPEGLPLVERCDHPRCGVPAVAAPAADMVRVRVRGSREPARWYCAGPCAAYGEALAEIRAIEGVPW
ncbi:hypothetical protein [Streptomyces sp. SID11385]|uniref:hypothetical protein n=1 Tax=Streptomyces sp. SID11385 TaxID=2706031 RepID=UPI0013CBAC51|nr:hypothetical protein [Streptomyces sp. SID11385]NEA42729.1 hypothetical protein [Streptomyces sp. SID11385]